MATINPSAWQFTLNKNLIPKPSSLIYTYTSLNSILIRYSFVESNINPKIPKLEIEEFEGVKREEVKTISESLYDLSLKLSGENMLLDLIESAKEQFNELYTKHLHSLKTRENLYEQFVKNQEIREEQEKQKFFAQQRADQQLERLM